MLTIPLELTAGDKIEMWLAQTTGGTQGTELQVFSADVDSVGDALIVRFRAAVVCYGRTSLVRDLGPLLFSRPGPRNVIDDCKPSDHWP